MAINSIANLTDSTVAGSNTQIQYNNSGVFGASSNLTFNGTDLIVTGNVGINESAPDTPLHVNGTYSSTEGALKLQSNNNDAAKLTFWNKDTSPNADSRRWALANNQSAFGDFQIQQGTSSTGDPTTAVMTFSKEGRLGIGAAPITGGRHYFSGAEDNGWAIRADNSTGTGPNGLYLYFTGTAPDNNTQRFLYCQDTGAARMEVFSDGDVNNHDNSYGAISDERLKQDIVDASSQWDDIKNLRVRKYKFISDVEAYGDDAVAHIGVIAQEAELVSPGLVQQHRVSDAVLDDEGNEVEPAVDQYSVQYSVLYMKCVKALQEAMERIETLEAQVAALQP